jgi:hypothetical protein
MSPRPSPLLGYNTNVRHKGKLYHIQTEDSGVDKPHIITHLFADGGRIIASSKTEYAEHVGSATLAILVKSKMQAQHKAMFIALRDGVYDDPAACENKPPAASSPAVVAAARSPDPELLERAAAEKLAASAALRPRLRKAVGAGLAKLTARFERKPSEAQASAGRERPAATRKTLDDVILSYLADEAEEDPPGGKR